MSEEKLENLRKEITTDLLSDDNYEILNLLVSRLKIGKKEYGHGLKIDDDTRKFGCKEDSWLEMELEEVLDGMIYTSATILRLQRQLKERGYKS